MELTLEAQETDFIIHIEGDVDLYSAPSLKDAFREVEDKKYKQYIVDLLQVKYLDSSALGALIFGAGIAKKNGGEFKCINVRPELKQMFATVKLSSLFGVN